MDIAAFVLALVALFLAFKNRGAARRADVDRLQSAVNRAEGRATEAAERAARLEQFVKRIAAGRKVDADMIEEGRLFDEVNAEEARRRVEAGGVLVLDVRTREEVEGGHIPGARWVPVDQLEKRWREVPRDQDVLVFCAAGARSAAACDFLSGRGYERVANVSGGMSAWRGAVERGLPAP